ICIYNIMSDTKFEVTEDTTGLDSSIFDNPQYSVSIDNGSSYNPGNGKAEGTIELDNHAFVVVTNTKKSVDWQLIKKSDTADSDIRLEGAVFELKSSDGTIYTGTSIADDVKTTNV